MSLQLTLREIPQFPPPWSFACAGRPNERRGRIALRRAFVDLKLSFMRVAAEVPGDTGRHLQTLVRQACEPIELWLIHGSLLAALPCEPQAGYAQFHRGALQAAFAASYPIKSPASA